MVAWRNLDDEEKPAYEKTAAFAWEELAAVFRRLGGAILNAFGRR